MSDTQKRDAVLEEFAHDAGVHRVWGVAGMADEILRLRGENAALRAEIDRLRDDLQKQTDWADWAKGEIDRLTVELGKGALRLEIEMLTVERDRAEAERDEEIARVVRITERLGAETLRADRAERILAALQHPREAVLHATNAKFPFAASMIRAAVTAAEQEVGG